MQIHLVWNMRFLGKDMFFPGPERTAQDAEVVRLARECDVTIDVQKGSWSRKDIENPGAGREARIVLEGADPKALLRISLFAQRRMLGNQFGVTSQVSARREFVGENADIVNILLQQLDICIATLQGASSDLDGGMFARASAALTTGRGIDQLLENLRR